MESQHDIESNQSNGEDNRPSKDHVIVILTIICLFLVFIVTTFTVWLLWHTCFRKWYQRRRLQRNPEQQRAAQLLNAPMQSIDLEVGVIHARSPPHWPLTDAAELQITTPSDYDEVTGHIQSRTSVYYDTYSNRTETTPLDASSPCTNIDGLDIADTALFNTSAVVNGVKETVLTNSDNSYLNPETMHFSGELTRDQELKEDGTDDLPEQRPNSLSSTVWTLEADGAWSETSDTRPDNSQLAREGTTGDETEDGVKAQGNSVEQYWAYYAY
ncbi:hypothetical protein NPX13_g8755 [Xylaria arbuscula]|uniref:Uncharacterized protein n=1 Tax=Xylaria arbuscula TaxID=114810 RepID=A0A9W8N836_9PEZI|nr:hypothetical protein NPX13_g8755 [Xylaria arbuscula]